MADLVTLEGGGSPPSAELRRKEEEAVVVERLVTPTRPEQAATSRDAI